MYKRQGPVWSIVEYNNEIHIGGAFFFIDGVSRKNIAKLVSGTWEDVGGSGASSTVYSMVTDGTNLYVGGEFFNINGIQLSKIAMSDGAVWSPIGEGFNRTVFTVTILNNNLHAGGRFTKTGSTNRFYVSRWSGSSWTSLAGGTDNTVYSLIEYDQKLIVGGAFNFVSLRTQPHIGFYTGFWQEFECDGNFNGFNDQVNASELYNGELIIGGNFIEAGGAPANYIARQTSTRWGQLVFGLDFPVYDLKVNGSDLYVGGAFSGQQSSSSLVLSRVARWNGSSWSALGDGVSGTIGDMAIYNSDLYVAGFFFSAGGVSIRYIASWDGSQWSAVGDDLDQDVYALYNWNNQLIAGGDFTTAGALSMRRVGSWNGSSWSSMGGGMNDDVFAFEDHNGSLYAGGNFTEADGNVVSRVARWNGTEWVHPGFDIDVAVRDMASFNGKLFIGGFGFLQVWDGNTLVDIPLVGSVEHLNVLNNELHVGGNFVVVDGQASSRFAILAPDNSPLHCSNYIKDADEIYVDCGGSCAPCTDCSHTNITISDRPMADELFIRASSSITSDGSIQHGRSTIFQTSLNTFLNPEFECSGELIVRNGTCD